MSPLNPECRSKPPQTPTLRIIKSHLNTVYGSKSPLAHVNPERENKPPQAPTLRVKSAKCENKPPQTTVDPECENKSPQAPMLRLKLAKEESQEKYFKGIMGHKIPNKNSEFLDDSFENKLKRNPLKPPKDPPDCEITPKRCGEICVDNNSIKECVINSTNESRYIHALNNLDNDCDIRNGVGMECGM